MICVVSRDHYSIPDCNLYSIVAVQWNCISVLCSQRCLCSYSSHFKEGKYVANNFTCPIFKGFVQHSKF